MKAGKEQAMKEETREKSWIATDVRLKADGGEHGGFTALVAVFGNLDRQGDIVLPGAFKDSLEARGDKPWPVIWSHQMWDFRNIIGKATATETDEGLVFDAEFLPTEDAQTIRLLMQEGLISEFSWSGSVREGAYVERDGEHIYEIRRVDLWEAGPCFRGANDETELLSIKSAVEHITSKEGRVLAQRHVDTLKSIAGSLLEVIASVEKAPTEDDPEKSAASAADKPPGTEPGTPPSTPTGVDLTTTKARLALSQEG